MAPFYGQGSTASRLDPLQGGSLLFTPTFPKIPGTPLNKAHRYDDISIKLLKTCDSSIVRPALLIIFKNCLHLFVITGHVQKKVVLRDIAKIEKSQIFDIFKNEASYEDFCCPQVV